MTKKEFNSVIYLLNIIKKAMHNHETAATQAAKAAEENKYHALKHNFTGRAIAYADAGDMVAEAINAITRAAG